MSGGARTPDEPVVVLSDEQAETALLTTADLGEGFVIDESSESPLGCLDAVEGLDGPDAATEAEVSFTDELGVHRGLQLPRKLPR